MKEPDRHNKEVHRKYFQGAGTGSSTCCGRRSSPGSTHGADQSTDHDKGHECNDEACGGCQNTGS